MQILHCTVPLASGPHATFWPTQCLSGRAQVKEALHQTAFCHHAFHNASCHLIKYLSSALGKHHLFVITFKTDFYLIWKHTQLLSYSGKKMVLKIELYIRYSVNYGIFILLLIWKKKKRNKLEPVKENLLLYIPIFLNKRSQSLTPFIYSSYPFLYLLVLFIHLIPSLNELFSLKSEVFHEVTQKLFFNLRINKPGVSSLRDMDTHNKCVVNNTAYFYRIIS